MDGRQEAHLIAITCSDVPYRDTFVVWTLQLLADYRWYQIGFAERKNLETVTPEDIILTELIPLDEVASRPSGFLLR